MLLAEARRAGVPFDEAFDSAVWAGWKSGGIRFPHQTHVRALYREALEATREEWRRAYEGLPSPISVALDELAMRPAEGDLSAPARVRGEHPARLAVAPSPTPSGRLSSDQLARISAYLHDTGEFRYGGKGARAA
jgi:hypothetical protein